MDAIGASAVAIVQGAPGGDGRVYGPSTEFYYLTGLETPHAHLVLDGRTRRSTLYLARRSEGLERSTDMMWSAEDATIVTRFASETHRRAAAEMLTFRGHLQHPVGQTVHDPGAIWGKPFHEGQVFTVDPRMWLPDEKLYARMEDTILVTKDGIENVTAALASTPDEIEAVMKQEGVLTRVARSR